MKKLFYNAGWNLNILTIFNLLFSLCILIYFSSALFGFISIVEEKLIILVFLLNMILSVSVIGLGYRFMKDKKSRKNKSKIKILFIELFLYIFLISLTILYMGFKGTTTLIEFVIFIPIFFTIIFPWIKLVVPLADLKVTEDESGELIENTLPGFYSMSFLFLILLILAPIGFILPDIIPSESNVILFIIPISYGFGLTLYYYIKLKNIELITFELNEFNKLSLKFKWPFVKQ